MADQIDNNTTNEEVLDIDQEVVLDQATEVAFLEAPGSNEAIQVDVEVGANLQIEGLTLQGTTFLQDPESPGNLIINLPNDGQVILTDFLVLTQTGLPPALTLADGTVISSQGILDLVENLDLDAIATAAGGATGGGEGGGGAGFAGAEFGDLEGLNRNNGDLNDALGGAGAGGPDGTDAVEVPGGTVSLLTLVTTNGDEGGLEDTDFSIEIEAIGTGTSVPISVQYSGVPATYTITVNGEVIDYDGESFVADVSDEIILSPLGDDDTDFTLTADVTFQSSNGATAVVTEEYLVVVDAEIDDADFQTFNNVGNVEDSGNQEFDFIRDPREPAIAQNFEPNDVQLAQAFEAEADIDFVGVDRVKRDDDGTQFYNVNFATAVGDEDGSEEITSFTLNVNDIREGDFLGEQIELRVTNNFDDRGDFDDDIDDRPIGDIGDRPEFSGLSLDEFEAADLEDREIITNGLTSFGINGEAELVTFLNSTPEEQGEILFGQAFSIEFAQTFFSVSNDPAYVPSLNIPQFPRQLREQPFDGLTAKEYSTVDSEFKQDFEGALRSFARDDGFNGTINSFFELDVQNQYQIIDQMEPPTRFAVFEASRLSLGQQPDNYTLSNGDEIQLWATVADRETGEILVQTDDAGNPILDEVSGEPIPAPQLVTALVSIDPQTSQVTFTFLNDDTLSDTAFRVQSVDMQANGFQIGLPQHSDDDLTFTVDTTTIENPTDGETNLENNGKTTPSPEFKLEVQAEADGVFLSENFTPRGDEDTTINMPSFSIGLYDQDGSEGITKVQFDILTTGGEGKINPAPDALDGMLNGLAGDKFDEYFTITTDTDLNTLRIDALTDKIDLIEAAGEFGEFLLPYLSEDGQSIFIDFDEIEPVIIDDRDREDNNEDVIRVQRLEIEVPSLQEAEAETKALLTDALQDFLFTVTYDKDSAQSLTIEANDGAVLPSNIVNLQYSVDPLAGSDQDINMQLSVTSTEVNPDGTVFRESITDTEAFTIKVIPVIDTDAAGVKGILEGSDPFEATDDSAQDLLSGELETNGDWVSTVLVNGVEYSIPNKDGSTDVVTIEDEVATTTRIVIGDDADNPIGELTVNGDGTWTFYVDPQVDHRDGDTLLSELSDSFQYKITDSDGDESPEFSDAITFTVTDDTPEVGDDSSSYREGGPDAPMADGPIENKKDMNLTYERGFSNSETAVWRVTNKTDEAIEVDFNAGGYKGTLIAQPGLSYFTSPPGRTTKITYEGGSKTKAAGTPTDPDGEVLMPKGFDGGKISVDYGVDGMGSLDVTPPEGLTSGGDDVTFVGTMRDDGVTYRLVGSTPESTVFVLDVNTVTGSWNSTQYGPLDHEEGGETDNALTMDFGLTITDSDGDPETGKLSITISDDEAKAIDHKVILAELDGDQTTDGLTTTINVQDIPGIDFGADGFGSLSVSDPSNLVSDYAAPTMSFDSDTGLITLTMPANFNGTFDLEYTVKDGDGDITSEQTISYQIDKVNDTPEAEDDGAGLPDSFGLMGEYYSYDGSIDNNVDILATLSAYANDVNNSPSVTFTAENLDFGPGRNTMNTVAELRSFIGENGTVNDDEVPTDGTAGLIKMSGAIAIGAGSHTLSVHSDDGYSVKITDADGNVIEEAVRNNNQSARTHNYDFDVAETGVYTIEIIYWDQGGNYEFNAKLDGSVIGGNAIYPSVPEDDTFVTMEDSALVLSSNDLLGNDFDVDKSQADPTIVPTGFIVAPESGIASVTMDTVTGEITVTPKPNFNGEASFTYTVTDVDGATDTATVTVGVVSVNDVPVIANDITIPAIDEDDGVITFTSTDIFGSAEVRGVVSDDDHANSELTLSNVRIVEGNGTLTGPVNGEYTFTPATNYNGPVEFSYTVTDPEGASATGKITSSVTAVNDDAVLGDDSGDVLSGLVGEFYSYDNKMDNRGDIIKSLTDYAAVNKPDATFVATTLDFAPAGGTMNTIKELDDFLGDNGDVTSDLNAPTNGSAGLMVMKGTIILDAGNNDLSIRADDGYAVFIDGKPVAVVNKHQGARTDDFKFDAGTGGEQTIEIVYWDQGGNYEFEMQLNGKVVGSEDGAAIQHGLGAQGTEDVALVIPVAKLLANDFDVDGDVLSISPKATDFGFNPAHISKIEVIGDNVVVTPVKDFFGPTEFTYKVLEGDNTVAGPNFATVSINFEDVIDVTPVADMEVITDYEQGEGGLFKLFSIDEVIGDSGYENNPTLGAADSSGNDEPVKVEITSDANWGKLSVDIGGDGNFVDFADMNGPVTLGENDVLRWDEPKIKIEETLYEIVGSHNVNIDINANPDTYNFTISSVGAGNSDTELGGSLTTNSSSFLGIRSAGTTANFNIEGDDVLRIDFDDPASKLEIEFANLFNVVETLIKIEVYVVGEAQPRVLFHDSLETFDAFKNDETIRIDKIDLSADGISEFGLRNVTHTVVETTPPEPQPADITFSYKAVAVDDTVESTEATVKIIDPSEILDNYTPVPEADESIITSYEENNGMLSKVFNIDDMVNDGAYEDTPSLGATEPEGIASAVALTKAPSEGTLYVKDSSGNWVEVTDYTRATILKSGEEVKWETVPSEPEPVLETTDTSIDGGDHLTFDRSSIGVTGSWEDGYRFPPFAAGKNTATARLELDKPASFMNVVITNVVSSSFSVVFIFEDGSSSAPINNKVGSNQLTVTDDNEIVGVQVQKLSGMGEITISKVITGVEVFPEPEMPNDVTFSYQAVALDENDNILERSEEVEVQIMDPDAVITDLSPAAGTFNGDANDNVFIAQTLDAAEDVFVVGTVNETGDGLAEDHDTIIGFDIGEDKIDLESLFDALEVTEGPLDEAARKGMLEINEEGDDLKITIDGEDNFSLTLKDYHLEDGDEFSSIMDDIILSTTPEPS